MRFEGKDIELRPLDSLETKKESNNFEDLDFIGYYDLFTDFYEKIDSIENDEDKYKTIERFQNVAHNLFDQNKNLSKDIFDSIYRKKELRDKVLNYSKEVDNFQMELFLDLKEKTPKLRECFKQDIHLFFENLSKKYNIDYDTEKVDYIIDNIDIKFFSSDIENIDINKAFYNSRHYIVFYLLPMYKNFNLFKKIFYHEFLHALTSDFENIISYKNKNNNEYNKGSQSIGLRFLGLNNKRFEWLNEAVTEQLAMNLTESEVSSSYVKERNLLDLLNKKKKEGVNIDFDLLTKIYFRHIQKRDEDDVTAVDQWREFSKEIDKAFGERFLIKLDFYINENGIDKALELISSWEDGKPNIDDLAVKNIKSKTPKDFYDIDDSEL